MIPVNSSASASHRARVEADPAKMTGPLSPVVAAEAFIVSGHVSVAQVSPLYGPLRVNSVDDHASTVTAGPARIADFIVEIADE